ncbi:hypothetical protein HDU96_001300 [Phlyctochytrium bullatum]|nr:hypothetical protein HDU96_001300 [Phlyctochytrium bullatum]
MATQATPIPQYAYVSDTGVTIANGPGSWEKVHSLTSVPKFFLYSPNGDRLAFVFDNRVEIFDARAIAPVVTIEIKGVAEAAFSPLGTYLSTWVRFVKGTGDEEPHKNLTLWNVATGSAAVSFTNKNQNGWNVQWTSTESHMARTIPNEIHVFASSNLAEPSAKVKVENLTSFSISPVGTAVAAFVPEKKGAPASVRVYAVGGAGTPVAQKSFFNADYVDFHWNNEGSAVLVLTHAEVDKTGQSYYGKSSLHYLSASGNFDAQVSVGDGPIHSVDWSPNSKEFMVIHGAMPSRATLFDHRAQTLFDFPPAPRNHVKYSPHGRFIAIGGFGNLSGDLDVWDRMTFAKLSAVHAGNASCCEWSPDGRHLLTATLYRRLKVDNGIRVWHYSGVLVHRVDVKEMYQVAWRADKAELWPKKKALSPAPTPTVQAVEAPVAKPKGVYRPPGARGKETPTAFTQRDQIFTNGNGADDAAADAAPMSKTAQKNAKKRAAKKNAEGASPATATPSAPATPASLPAFIPTEASAKVAEIEKRLKAVGKKLKSIKELKERKAKGEKLEATQLQKIESEAEVVKEMEELQAKLAAAS